MAVRIFCDDPAALLNAIRRAIDSGKVATWEYDRHGYFLHTAPQWKYLAWLKPRVLEDQLLLTTVNPKGKKVTRVAYAVYHGRFIEMVLSHFDRMFVQAVATAMPTRLDRVAPEEEPDD